MLRQYFEAKDANPGVLMAIRVGDFYEFSGEDAETAARNLDHFDGRFMKLAFVVGETLPVAVGTLDDDLSLLQKTLEKESYVKLLVLRFRDADGDILEIDE